MTLSLEELVDLDTEALLGYALRQGDVDMRMCEVSRPHNWVEEGSCRYWVEIFGPNRGKMAVARGNDSSPRAALINAILDAQKPDPLP